MKRYFWLLLITLGVFIGCTNDASVEHLGKQRSAASLITLTTSVAPSTDVIYGDSFTFSYDLESPGNPISGQLRFIDKSFDFVAFGTPVGVESQTTVKSSFDVSSSNLGFTFNDMHNLCAQFLNGQGLVLAESCQIITVFFPQYTDISFTQSAVADPQEFVSFVYGEALHVSYQVFPSQIVAGGTMPPPPPPLTGTMHIGYRGPSDKDATFIKDCPVLDDGTGSCDISNAGPWIPAGTWYMALRFEPSNPKDYRGTQVQSEGTINVANADTISQIKSPATGIVDIPVDFQIEVHPSSPSTAPPTGTVSIYLDGSRTPLNATPVTLTTDATNGFSTATINVTSPSLIHTVGQKHVHVVYTPDVNFNGSQSITGTDGFVIDIELDGTTLAFASSPASWSYGTNALITVTVAGTNPSAGAPQGVVKFYDGHAAVPTAFLGQDTLHAAGPSQIAQLSIPMTTVGQRTILAVYEPSDGKHNTNSNELTQTVAQATPNLGITLSSSDVVYSTPITFKATIGGPVGASAPTGNVHFYYLNGATEVGIGSNLDIGSGSAQTIDANTPIGNGRTIRVRYVGDTNYAAVFKDTTLNVHPDPSTLTLVSSSEPAVVTSNITFTATVAKTGTATATPTGSVVFKEGATTLGTSPISGAGTATLDIATLPVGPHSITASYDGNTSWVASSATITQTVNAAGVIARVQSSPNPANVGDTVTIIGTFSSEAAGPATGSIEFFDDTTSLGVVPLAGGTAQVTSSTLGYGPHVLKAVYGGDALHAAATATTSQVMNRVATSTDLSTSAASTTEYGAPVPLTAKVTSSGAGTPTGFITFKDGATVLGSSTLDGTGTATFTANLLPVGSHTFTAAYSGDLSRSPSTSTAVPHTVTKVATTVALVSSSNPSPLTFGVTFTATVTGSAPGTAPSGTVTFKDGATVLGATTLTTGAVATFTTSTLTAGAHTITASYAGDNRFSSADSSPLTQTVSANAAAITLTSAPNPSITGGSVVISASLAGALGIPSGTITFKQGGAAIGAPVALDATGKATTSTTTLPIGTLTLTAEYSGDSQYGAGTASVAHVVKKIATTATLTAGTSTAAVGTAISFQVSVTAGPAPASGDVDLFDATSPIATTTLSAGGLGTFSVSTLTPGDHQITAIYKGTATLSEGKSNTLNITITTGGGSSSGDAGADGGSNLSSGGTSGSGTSSSSGAPPGSGSSSAGAVNTSGGLNIAPGSGSNGGDDCAMTPGSSGTFTVPMLIGLIAVLARRRRKVA